jgi:hypothetical protein
MTGIPRMLSVDGVFLVGLGILSKNGEYSLIN